MAVGQRPKRYWFGDESRNPMVLCILEFLGVHVAEPEETEATSKRQIVPKVLLLKDTFWGSPKGSGWEGQ